VAGENPMKLGLLPLLIACLIGGCCCDIGHQQMQPDPNVGASVECYAVNDDEYCFAEAKQLCPKATWSTRPRSLAGITSA
jgi:hypothetical protein